jgi:hypothetical protein
MAMMDCPVSIAPFPARLKTSWASCSCSRSSRTHGRESGGRDWTACWEHNWLSGRAARHGRPRVVGRKTADDA